ncbi:hypothetical protein LJC08_00820 [Methanimicrococcus sp. OttesenSCG-928-J09]|nr:hypothetical protein [Methanimicrococcus sp. OttesenSCG-928-J09]
MFVTNWSQVLVLQWEGGLHLKSLRDFSGCRRCNTVTEQYHFSRTAAACDQHHFQRN